MGGPRFFWAVAVAVIPMAVPAAVMAQASPGMRSADLGRTESKTGHVFESAPKKPSRRGRNRSSPAQDDRSATNDWNPHYLKGREYFVQGQYESALTELKVNVADCDHIDFEAMRRQNGYFEHIWNSIPSTAQDPHAFIRASNLQWVGATLAAQGRYDLAETSFIEMENYAQKCFPGKMSTFEGCSCQGLAFLLAARGQYDQAANRYRLALSHIEGNQSQIGLPPAPCVAMILTALADVELACGHLRTAEQCMGRAERVQEAQHQLGLGPAPLDRAALLTVLAQLRHCQQRQSEAYDLYADSLGIIQNIRKDHPLIGYCLEGLAEIDLERGRLEQSEDHFRESLKVRRASLGKTHREVAYSLDGLARVTAARGDHDRAEVLSRDARSILTHELGPRHPDVVAMAALSDRTGDRPHTDDKTPRPRPRFLTIPTFVTVGWQVLDLGRDWRTIEAGILWREVKEAKTAHRSPAPAAASAHNGH
jgi:tetratricopeptide (TPR) repeat protein